MKPRRWYQFSLRTMFALTTVSGVLVWALSKDRDRFVYLVVWAVWAALTALTTWTWIAVSRFIEAALLRKRRQDKEPPPTHC